MKAIIQFICMTSILFAGGKRFTTEPTGFPEQTILAVINQTIAYNSPNLNFDIRRINTNNSKYDSNQNIGINKELALMHKNMTVYNYSIPFDNLVSAIQFQEKIQKRATEEKNYKHLMALLYDNGIADKRQQKTYDAFISHLDNTIRKYSERSDSLIVIHHSESKVDCEFLLAFSYQPTPQYYSLVDSILNRDAKANIMILDYLVPDELIDQDIGWISEILSSNLNNITGIYSRASPDKRGIETTYFYYKLIEKLYLEDNSIFETISNSFSSIYAEGSALRINKPIKERFIIYGDVFNPSLFNTSPQESKSINQLAEKVIYQPRIIAHPNPFNPEISINIEGIASEQDLEVKIYNITGQLVYKYVCHANENHIWNGANINGRLSPGGVYILVAQTKSIRISKKLIYLR